MLPRLAQPWRFKPEIPVEIDRGSPLARGLVFCALPGSAGPLVDLVSGASLPAAYAGSRLTGPQGRAAQTVYSLNYRSNVFPNLAFPTGSQFSVGCIASVTALEDTDLLFCGGVYYYDLGISGLRYTSIINGTGGNNDLVGSVATLGDVHMALAWNDATPTGSLFVNGKLVNNVPRGTSQIGSYVGDLRLGYNPAQNNGSIYFAYAYSRLLSAAEIAALYENPWQLLRPLRRRLIYPYLKPINSISVLNEGLSAAGMANEALTAAGMVSESLQ